MIKVDVEGAEYSVVRGATKTLARLPSPVWICEICLTEHHPSGVNPNFLDMFRIFSAHGYEARTVGGQGQIITQQDVEGWVRNCKRDFGSINYVFQKSPSSGG